MAKKNTAAIDSALEQANVSGTKTDTHKPSGRTWRDYTVEENLEHILLTEKGKLGTGKGPELANEINSQGYPLKVISRQTDGGSELGFYRQVQSVEKKWNPRLNWGSQSPGGWQYGLVFEDGGYRPLDEESFKTEAAAFEPYKTQNKPYYVHVTDTDDIYRKKLRSGTDKANRNIKAEVERDELILSEDGDGYKVVHDFKNADTHEEGGQPYTVKKGEIVIPADNRDAVLNAIKDEDWEVIDDIRGQLPDELPIDKKLQEGLDNTDEEKAEKPKAALSQTQGISNFLNDAITKQGKQFSSDAEDAIFKSYNYDYDRIIDDMGKRMGVGEDKIRAFRESIYSKYGIVKPDEENIAEISFLRRPVGQGTTGYERYSQLQEEKGLAEALLVKQPEDLRESIYKDSPAYQYYKTGQSLPSLEGKFDENLQLTPEARQEEIKKEYSQSRINDIQKRIDEIDAAMAEQAEVNRSEFGHVSQKAEEWDKLYGKLEADIQNTIDEVKASRPKYNQRGGIHAMSGAMKFNPNYEATERLIALQNMKDFAEEARKTLDAPQEGGIKGFSRGLLYGISNNILTKDFATLGLSEIQRLSSVKDAFEAKQQLSKEGKSEEEIRQLMPKEQLQLLDTYQLLLNIQAGTEQNFGVGIGEGLVEMIPFILQFAATGGTGASAKQLVKDFVTRTSKSAVAGEIVGTIAKPLAQAAVMVPATMQNYAERVAPTLDEEGKLVEGENEWQALAKAYLTTVAEVTGEDIGQFSNKWANKAARKNFTKLIANNPTKAQEFLGKLQLAVTRETGMPAIQGLPFEILGEEATGLMQASIDQDGSFFTPEAQKQLLVLSALASGGFAAASMPQRIALKSKYNRATELLNDIPNAEYAAAVNSISENYTEPEEMFTALNDINKQFTGQISNEDVAKGLNYLDKSISYSQMNTVRAIQIEQNIARYQGNDGNVTMAQYNGQAYAVRNPESLGKPGEVVYLKAPDDSVIPVISSKVTEYETKTPDQIVEEQISEQDQQDQVETEAKQMQADAESKGLIEGNTVNTPYGKRTLVTVNPDGTSTVTDQKGEESIVNTSEIEAYKTQEQKDAEKVEAEAQMAMMEGIEEGAEVLSDEPLAEGSDVRVVDFSNGQSKIITPEREQVFNTPEERDTAIAELAQSEVEAAETNIDELPADEAYRVMYSEDPEIATEVFTQRIEEMQSEANEARNQSRETRVTSEKKALITKARELEANIERYNQILSDPDAFMQEAVTEEVAEEPTQELTPEQETFNQADTLYNEYLEEEKNTPYNQLEDWQKELLGSRITSSSFNRFGDRNMVNQNIARAWFIPSNQAGASNEIDVLAEEISQATGQQVTPQDIVDFIIGTPTNTVRKTTDRMNEIRSDYNAVTGQSINNHNALRDKLGLEPAPAIEMVEDVVDDPLTVAKAEDAPFRVEENIEVSDQASEVLKTRTNASKAINTLANQLELPLNIIMSNEVPKKLNKDNVIYNEYGIVLAYVDDGRINVVADNIDSVSGVKKAIIKAAINIKGIDGIGINTSQSDAAVAKDIRKAFGLTSRQFSTEDLAPTKFDPQVVFDSIQAPNAAKVIVVNSKEELPEHIQNHELFNWDRFDAVFYNDTIYANNNAIKDSNDAMKLWIHENGLHNGIRTLIPDATDRATLFELVHDSVRDMTDASPELQAVFNRVTQGAYKNRPKAEQGEEILAFYAEKIIRNEDLTPAEQTLWNKIVTYIRDILSNLYQFDAQALTEKDIANIIYSSVKSNFNEYRGINPRTGEEIRQRKGTGEVNFAGSEGRNVSGPELQGAIEDEVQRGEVKFRAEPAGQINSEQFKKWFANSEVVDENGNPLVVYHGTNADFTEFDPRKQTTTAHGYGFYFATDRAVAEGYERGDQGQLIEAYLSIQQPLDDNAPNFSIEEMEDIVSEILNLELEKYADEIESWRDSFMSNIVDTYSVSKEEAVSEIASQIVEYNDTANDAIAELSNIVGDRQTTQQAVKNTLGYDGIFVKDFQETDGDVYIAWFPEQVKSATDNIGTFDETNPDIRFRVAESQQELDDFVKDSKVKETVYHGTQADFTEFDPEMIGATFAADERGFFFTDNKKWAQDYASSTATGMPAEGGRVMSVRLDLKSPLVIDSKWLNKEGMGGVFEREDPISFWDNYQALILEEVDKANSDGVIIDDGDNKMMVAFSNDQILIEPKEDVKFRTETPTVYHGSDQIIDKFDIGKATGSGKASRNKAGIFFTSDENFAKSWGENLNERKLTMNKPLKEGNTSPEVAEILGEKGFTGNIKQITEKKANKIKELGYDGVIGFERWTDWNTNERKKSDVYMVFDEDAILEPGEVRFKVVHHGTLEDFDQFKLPTEDEARHEYYGKAIYLSDSEDVAKGYGDRVISKDIPDSMVDKVIDAKGGLMREIEGLTDIVKEGGIIRVDNVQDKNLVGAQVKDFKYGEEGDDAYKYPKTIHSSTTVKRLSPKMKEMINEAKSKGVDLDASKGVFGTTIMKKRNQPLTPKEAEIMQEIGFDVTQQFGRTPETASTYIIAGDEALSEVQGLDDVKFKVESERTKVNQDPSDAQKSAGNYQMGHVKVDGLDISIENPIGSIREGKAPDGERWSNIMPADYGYIRGTVGKDKDHLDVFLGPNLESNRVFIVDQVDPNTGKFDEHKILIGFNSLSEARNTYNEAYDEDWQGLGAITPTTKDGLKEWLKGDTKKPYALEEEARFRVKSDDPEVQKVLDRLQALQKASQAAARVREMEGEAKAAMPLEREYIQDQIKSLKEGYKSGKAETKEMIKEVQKAITDYAKKNLPLTEAGAREISPILTLVKDAQTPEAIEKAFNKIDELTGRTEEKRERRKNTNRVNRLLTWMTGLKKVGQKKVGKFNYADTKDFLNLGDIDKRVKALVKKSNARNATAEEKMAAENELEALWNQYNEMPERNNLDNAIMKLIELRRLGSKTSAKLAQTTADELEAIYKVAKEAKNEADLNKALNTQANKDEIIDYLETDDKVKKMPWFKKAMRQINTATADIMGNWETLMTMIGGTELRDKMSFLLDEAQMTTGRQQTMDTLLDQAKDLYGSKSKRETLNTIHELSSEEYELRQPNRRGQEGKGDPMKLSRLQLMDIYNGLKNPDIERDYYLAYGDIVLAEDGSRDIEAQMEDGKQRIDALLDNLTEVDKEFADTMQKELDKYYDKMNEIYINLYNRDLPRVENYWPSSAEREQDVDIAQLMFTDSRHPGATKERSAHRTPMPKDAFNKFVQHVDEAEWYTNMAMPIYNANKLFKDNNIKTLIEDSRGKTFYNNVSDALQNVGLTPPAKMQQSSKLTSMLNTVLGNWVVGKIGMSPSVVFKQLLSTVNYAENMPAGTWAKNFVKDLSNPKETWKEMMEIPYLKTRLGEGYSEAVQRALNGDEQIHKSKVKNYHDAFKNLMTIGTRYGDITAIIFGGKPYIDYMIKEQGMSQEEAVDKFLQDTLRSQQAPFSSSLSKLQNSKNPFLRAMFTFANTPSQYMRKLFEANQNYRVAKRRNQAGKMSDKDFAKVKKQTAKAHAIYGVINTISFTMAGALVNTIMKGADFDDDIWKDMLAQLSSTYVGGLPVIKDILDTATRQTLDMKVYDDVNPYVESASTLLTEGGKLLRGEATERTGKLIGQSVADMLGVPYHNLEKNLKALPPMRDETVKGTRTRETEDKLNRFSKSDFAPKANAAKEVKKVYGKAKSKATKLEKAGRYSKAQRITDLIERSKVNLWKGKFSVGEMKMEAKQIEKMVDRIN